ncbi:MAG: PA2169 family four-helix-bundle protein [Acidobacteriota bacterium]|nr:PA2169 family four-helix-bundle protein [Acidobacteriota bacterium]
MATVTVDRCVDQLNSLLRGEISSVETYEQAIRKVDDEHASDATALRAIAQEHGEAAQALRDEIRRLGGEADNSSGPWGVWAKVVEGTAKLFGDASALKALKEGEEHGLKDYREALDDVDEPARVLITNRLIPNQVRHIAVLDGMIAKIAELGD